MSLLVFDLIKSLIVGTFRSDQLIFNFAPFKANLRDLSSFNWFSSANFWIRSICCVVVARDTNCDKIVGTSVSASNLKMSKDQIYRWILNIWSLIQFQLTQYSFHYVFQWRDRALNQDSVDMSSLIQEPRAYLVDEYRWTEWGQSISNINGKIGQSSLWCQSKALFQSLYLYQVGSFWTAQCSQNGHLFSGNISRFELIPQAIPLIFRSFRNNGAINHWHQINWNSVVRPIDTDNNFLASHSGVGFDLIGWLTCSLPAWNDRIRYVHPLYIACDQICKHISTRSFGCTHPNECHFFSVWSPNGRTLYSTDLTWIPENRTNWNIISFSVIDGVVFQS